MSFSPMMEQYFDIKKKYKHCLLFFRLGDFYEMFYDDALIASKELDLILTGKNCGQEERAPMCGVPFHSAESYISKLVSKGYKVAICEQVENPKNVKGIVKRDVIRVITPGTLTDSSMLDEEKNNYILCIYGDKNGYGLAVCDVSTGEFLTTEFTGINAEEQLKDECAKFNPSEIIANEGFTYTAISDTIEKRLNIKIGIQEDWIFEYNTANVELCRHFFVDTIDGFGLKNKMFCVCASGSLMKYLKDTQKNNLGHISKISYYSNLEYMLLDMSSRRNLELTETMREKNKKGSLLWVVDNTKTPMGARLLRSYIERPLIDCNKINFRLNAVEEIFNDFFLREELREFLGFINDFERIITKVIYQTANGRDIVALKKSISNIPALKDAIKDCSSEYMKSLYESIDTLEDIYELIDDAIIEDNTPFSIKEGGIIKVGFNKELDVFIQAKKNGVKWLDDIENKEREKTGIKGLKIGYNRIFGHYIEVTKANIENVPKDKYIRKQTLANCERYTTEELLKLSELILSSDEKSAEKEYEVFCELREHISSQAERIQNTAHIIAQIDVMQSMAEAAVKYNYVKPVVDQSGIIDIKDGRHPVIDKMLDGSFISNDTYLDMDENTLSIITGPNMAGKSTYMRQTALITLMAQLGSFVPAQRARVGVVDRIFTRVGASDDLASGQSTFMIEMIEVSNILNNATKNSLIILDEIGRGTSTFDGLSIAWAVLEYIADKTILGAKTLFATHYHEITELEGKLKSVKNYRVTIEESNDNIVFLRKIVSGSADNSYGIQVGKLAGLPKKVIKRANDILKQLNTADITKKAKKISMQSKDENIDKAKQINIFTSNETQIIDDIKKMDVMKLTPIEALQTLLNLQKKAKGL